MVLVSKTNKYQPTGNILQLQNFAKLYTNTTIANFSRSVFNVFDKSRDCIAALNHIRCTVPKYTTLNDIQFVPKDVNALGSVRMSLILKL